MPAAIGIDIGGTFIDVVIADEHGTRHAKFPSSADTVAESVLDALRELASAGEVQPGDVQRVIHGSTVATNALLEASWGRTALVTTRGFRDVLEIGRQARPRLYDLFYERPPAIVPRDLRFEVAERLASDGAPLVPLDEKEVERLVPRLRQANVDAIAIVFLFSFLDPAHERTAARILTEALSIPVVLSSDVLPEFREYERTSTTVVAAALRPVVGEYLTRLQQGATGLGLPRCWQIMQSSGAVTSAEIAELEPARVILSGPAGGVQGARAVGAQVGAQDVITMDMGGTSCDVGLIRDGRIGWSTHGVVGGHPIALPMVEVETIGAGGGSIARVDRGGALRVGPESAGAIPGPACYGRGGERPTVTDAHVVLGHLDPDRAFGGLVRLDVARAVDAVRSIAEPLGVPVGAAALGILEVGDAAMERAIRVISVERGVDPRELALLAFGGAGPLHAVSVARRLSIPRVIVPARAGVLSAFGLLSAEAGHDYSRGIVRPLRSLDAATIARIVSELSETGSATLVREGVDARGIGVRVSADLRYEGQSHELNVEIPPATSFGAEAIASLETAFHEAHAARFGHAAPDDEVELVAIRVRAFSEATPLVPARVAGDESKERVGEAWFDAAGPVETRFVARDGLDGSARLVGPTVVLGTESTVLVPPGASGTQDAFGNILLEVG